MLRRSFQIYIDRHKRFRLIDQMRFSAALKTIDPRDESDTLARVKNSTSVGGGGGGSGGALARD